MPSVLSLSRGRGPFSLTAAPHRAYVRRVRSRSSTACSYTRQRPKIVEKSGDDIELKARSQPTGTRFSARMSDGCDLGPFLIGADPLLSRSPLSV